MAVILIDAANLAETQNCFFLKSCFRVDEGSELL